jgi:hypothetical protein
MNALLYILLVPVLILLSGFLAVCILFFGFLWLSVGIFSAFDDHFRGEGEEDDDKRFSL